MASKFIITAAVSQAMLAAMMTAANADTGAVIEIYAGTVPTTAEASVTGNILLARLTCSKPMQSGIADTTNAARATLAAVTSDSSAANTGTATFFRIYTKSSASSGTPIAQGTVGTSDADLILNTVAITAGSQVSVTSGNIDQPKGTTN